MPYRLVLSEPIEKKTDVVGEKKALGEDIFLYDMPQDCKVYMLYYPGALPDEELEKGMRNLGNISGKNLFVNIGRLDEPNYDTIASKFGIKRLPVIIVTAYDQLAYDPIGQTTAFIKLDDRRLLNSPQLTIDSLQTIFNLFIQGNIYEAIKQANADSRAVLISDIAKLTSSLLNKIGNIFKDFEISISLLGGKLELKRGGG